MFIDTYFRYGRFKEIFFNVKIISLFYSLNKLAVVPLHPCDSSRLLFSRSCADLHILVLFLDIHKYIFFPYIK